MTVIAGLAIGAIGSAGFAVLVWGSILLVLLALAYIVWALFLASD